jgi:hypothetical protein
MQSKERQSIVESNWSRTHNGSQLARTHTHTHTHTHKGRNYCTCCKYWSCVIGDLISYRVMSSNSRSPMMVAFRRLSHATDLRTHRGKYVISTTGCWPSSCTCQRQRERECVCVCAREGVSAAAVVVSYVASTCSLLTPRVSCSEPAISLTSSK